MAEEISLGSHTTGAAIRNALRAIGAGVKSSQKRVHACAHSLFHRMGNLPLQRARPSSKNDFDYLVGSWNIKNRTLKEQLAGSDEWENLMRPRNFA